MSEFRLCMGCMEQILVDAEFCPVCGFSEKNLRQPAHYLAPHTILHGKYILGKGLGHGGFGITYLAYDTVLGRKLAIKEYLPQDCSSRQMGTSFVVPFSGEYVQRFEYGKGQFLGEARTLARFDGHPNIVDVRDYFEENGTAYLVMSFLEGVTLRDYLQFKRTPLPFLQVMQIMQPVILALADVHRIGILHRDISPDNIFLSTTGVKLIDFGAARQSLSAAHSVSVILKPGYAPQEQYRTHGNQGPWTDIYALAACMYRALTGKIPPESLDRAHADDLFPPSRLGSDIPPEAERILLRAMAVEAQDRYASIEEMQQAFWHVGIRNFNSFVLSQQQLDAIKWDMQNRQPPSFVQVPMLPMQSVSQEEQEENEEEEPGNHRTLRIVLLCAMVVLIVLAGVLWALSELVVQKPEETKTLVSLAPSVQPTLTPSSAVVPASAQPTQTPLLTSTPGFTQGMVNALKIERYLPPYAKMMTIFVEGYVRTYLSDYSANQKYLLMVPYDFNQKKISGEIMAYWVNIEGNLLQTNYSTQESVVVLPRDLRVGENFAGGTIAAVNYEQSFGTETQKDMIVVKKDQDFFFYVPDIGLYAIRRGSLTGEIVYQMVSVEDAQPGLLLDTYQTQFGLEENDQNDILIMEE